MPHKKNNNGYLKKRDTRVEVNIRWTRQVDMDALLLTCEDNDFPFEKAIEFARTYMDYADEISIGLTTATEASHKRRQTDDRLKNYCGEDFIPWTARYDYYDDRGI